jgi:hydroxyacylglutathione hydrolase
MIQIETLVFNPFMENTYVLYEDSGECIIFDAGCYEENEKDELLKFIDDNNLKPVELINTHCHVDHVLGVSYLKEKYKIPFRIHELEKNILKATPSQGSFFGLNPGPAAEPDGFINEGDSISLGKSSLSAIHIPGHSPGSLVFYSQDDSFLLSGDVLFRGSIGRTDLPGGDHDKLLQSIHEKLLVLDPETMVYPGHGQHTSIGIEKDHNPFLS